MNLCDSSEAVDFTEPRGGSSLASFVWTGFPCTGKYHPDLEIHSQRQGNLPSVVQFVRKHSVRDICDM